MRFVTSITLFLRVSLFSLSISRNITNGFNVNFSPRTAKTIAPSLGLGRNHEGLGMKDSVLHSSISENEGTSPSSSDKKKVVVIGGGWAGYSASESLSSNSNVEIILLDAAAKARGGLAGGYRKEGSSRPVEAGIHGFWREYRNTFDMMERIGGVDVDECLSDYTPCTLFSKNGKVALAPVLGAGDEASDGSAKAKTSSSSFPLSIPAALPQGLDEKSIRKFLAANLPPPLDLALLAEFDERNGGSKLLSLDRISAIGLLGAWADFEQESPESWRRYDAIPASELFEQAGVTDALYEELVSPLLHVLPMCPAYDCSAAAALSCFHVFALQSRGAFDVRWCNGNISEKIFSPWKTQLEERGVEVRGGARVFSIDKVADVDENNDSNPDMFKISLEGDSHIECDAVVLAVGGTSMGKIAASSPAISSLDTSVSKEFDKLRGVTCVAVRLFLKPHPIVSDGLRGGLHSKTQLPPDMASAMKDSPVAVCGAGMGGIKELEETGFCIYDLQRMHNEFSVDATADANEEEEQVAVLEVDFFRADDLANLSNDEIANIALEAVATTLRTQTIDSGDIVDLAVVRARNAVSHFAPLSASYSPDVKLDNGLYICGDWVDRTGHASWSTEKSVVTAKQAAEKLSMDLGLKQSYCRVIPAAEDTAQLATLRKGASLLRNIAPIVPPSVVPPSPWVFAKELLSK